MTVPATLSGTRLAYICAPLRAVQSADVARNVSLAQCAARAVAQRAHDVVPIVPHVAFGGALDHHRDHARAMDACLQLVGMSDVLVVVGDQLTAGMRQEIDHAKRLGVEIEYLSIGEIRAGGA